ncbi:type II secretion system F family protein [Litorisediminicola beolgyonensis]|uniref:Type II secretion system F family protein n=1 Tax=Litorisediminicola beolgyonensis TaxID=1173614 RepID=A0ABW3ZDB1_9RHOB
MLENPFIFYGLFFAAALLIADTLLRLLTARRRSEQQVKNRMQALKAKKGETAALSELLSRRRVPGDGRMDIFAMFTRTMAQTGLEISTPRRLLYLFGLFAIGIIISTLFLGLTGFVRLGFGIVFALAVAWFAIVIMRRRRINTFTTQLAPAIEIIVRSLNAGHPLNSAIALVAREMPDPIGSEFGILSSQLTFGSDLHQGFLNMIQRVGAPELNLLAVTVSVQRGTGGNLSEILENLAKMIRDRLMLKAKIRAISAEGRMTSWIMLGFPFFLFFMIKVMVPDYYDELWESGYGTHVVVTCLILMFFGMIIIRKLVNFDF